MPASDATANPPRTSPVVAGGAGVVAGAGISTGLFTTIGIAKILSSPSGVSTTYPLVVFSLAALFLLTAAFFSLRVTPQQRPFLVAGLGCFMVLVVVGAGLIFWEDYNKPTITFTEIFQPDGLTGNGMASPKLRLVYKSVSAPNGDYIPINSNRFSVTKDAVIALKVEGMDDLLTTYKTKLANDDNVFRMLQKLCARPSNQSSEFCDLIVQAPVLPS